MWQLADLGVRKDLRSCRRSLRSLVDSVEGEQGYCVVNAMCDW